MTARKIFVTGGSGFVGRRLLAALAGGEDELRVLDRSGSLRLPGASNFAVVKGDLLEPESYRASLGGCDVVLHLAAATGRASAEVHQRVNAQGTETLVKECQAAGVRNFVLVSSIAVTFPDLRGYHYALTKQDAERVVRESGLRSLIVRPTMILGPGAPVLASLEKLATLPVAVVPGSGRARVQPIHVEDVVSCLVAAVRTDPLDHEVVAVGGPETISIEALLRRIRLARRGKAGPLLCVPLVIFDAPIRVVSMLGLGGLLPITPGQLTSFRFDGVGEPNRFQSAGGSVARGLDNMLEAARPAHRSSDLGAECDVFTRYLLGREATDYVRAKYLAAHTVTPALTPRSAFDRFLVRFARTGALFTRLADAHAALFAPASSLRKKLVLLLAILETCPPFHHLIDAPLGGSPLRAVIRLIATGLVAAFSIVAGSIILLPLRLVFAVVSGDRK